MKCDICNSTLDTYSHGLCIEAFSSDQSVKIPVGYYVNGMCDGCLDAIKTFIELRKNLALRKEKPCT